MVANGTITQDQENTIDSTLQTAMQALIAAQSSSTSSSSTTTKTDTAKVDPLASLVSNCTITKDQETAITSALKSAFQANIPVTNASLLLSGTITQTQEDTFATAKKAYGN